LPQVINAIYPYFYSAIYMLYYIMKRLYCNENNILLYYRFTSFVTKYNLMSKDNLIVPIMEGDGATESEA